MLNTMITALIGDRANALRQNTWLAGTNPGSPLAFPAEGGDPQYNQQKPLLQLQNTVTSTTITPYSAASADAQRLLVPWYLRLTVTNPGSGITSFSLALQLIPRTGQSIQPIASTGGTLFGAPLNNKTYLTQPYMDLTQPVTPPFQSPITQTPVGNCIWAPSGSGFANNEDFVGGRIVIRNTAPVTGDVYILSFGEAMGTAMGWFLMAGQPGYQIIPAPMVQVGRGSTLNVLVSAPNLGGGPSFEVEMAWFELKV